MAAGATQTYLRRAKDFFEAMSLLDEPEFSNAAALLAIHSAIANCDALRSGMGVEKLAAEDHQSAGKALEKLLKDRRHSDLTGLSNLQYLISQKSAVAYGPRMVDRNESRRLTERAERFSRWVTKTGRRLDIQEWRYANE